MKTIFPYIILILTTAALTAIMVSSKYFRPVKNPDPADKVILKLKDQNKAKNDSIQLLRSYLSEISDTLAQVRADYDKKPFPEIVKVFIGRTGVTDTTQKVIAIDSSQVDACNRCFMSLDSNRAVVKVQHSIITLADDAIGACSAATALLSKQVKDCRTDVENWEKLYNLKWWQIFKRMNIKRKLK